MARSGPLAQPPRDRQPTAAGLGSAVRGWLRGRRARLDAGRALYARVVEQSRLPVFYADWGVPDSRGGRLEMVTLHAVLAMRRLRREGRRGGVLAQALLDLVFADLDRHLREWGVGDPSMGKEMKKLAQSFHARVRTLDPLLDGSDPEALDAVLGRNVYAEVPGVEPAAVRRLAAYLLAQDLHLAGQDGASVLGGDLAFGHPDELGAARGP